MESEYGDTSGQRRVFYPFEPDWVVAPGAMLAEHLEEAGHTAAELAEGIYMPLEHVEALIAGEATLTDEDARLLELGTSIPARLWSRMEAIYREGLAAGKKRV